MHLVWQSNFLPARSYRYSALSPARLKCLADTKARGRHEDTNICGNDNWRQNHLLPSHPSEGENQQDQDLAVLVVRSHLHHLLDSIHDILALTFAFRTELCHRNMTIALLADILA